MRRLIGYAGLKERGIPYSRPHIWRLIQKGKFPKPIKFDPGKSRSQNLWADDEIDRHIESLMAHRGGTDDQSGAA